MTIASSHLPLPVNPPRLPRWGHPTSPWVGPAGHVSARVELGWSLLNDPETNLDAASRCFTEALATQPHHADAVAGAAQVLFERQRVREAWQLLQRTRLRSARLALVTARVAQRVGLPEAALAVVRDERRQAAPRDRARLLHAEGDLYDALGDHRRAWRAWSLANRDRGLCFDVASHLADVARFIAATRKLHPAAGEGPTFVAGLSVSNAPHGHRHLPSPEELVHHDLSTATFLFVEGDDDRTALAFFRAHRPRHEAWACSLAGIQARQRALRLLRAHLEERLPGRVHRVRPRVQLPDPAPYAEHLRV